MNQKIALLLCMAAFLAIPTLFACSRKGDRTNLALLHPARHSSSIDYNTPALLAVDGIFEKGPARWVEVCGPNGVPFSKREHDLVFDPRPWTSVRVEGPNQEISVRTHGFREVVDKISLTLSAQLTEGRKQTSYRAEIQYAYGSEWRALKAYEGSFKGGALTLEWDKGTPIESNGWRFFIEIPGADSIEWQTWLFYRDGKLLPMLTSEHFHSAWVPATGGQEWLAVDLGGERRFSEVRLHWLNAPAKGVLQVSEDSSAWRDLAVLDGTENVRCDTLKVRGRGRWVRVLLDGSVDGKPYALTEMEVFGPQPDEKPRQTGWELARVLETGETSAWIPATVPGTVLVSYLDNGMLPDPNYGENFLYISDSYFLAPFIYRTRLTLPEGHRPNDPAERIRLHFDGINWKADVVLNGKPVGRIEGAFTDASFDVTELLNEDNLLEVTVYPPAHPGMTKENTQERCATNGGILGADNPTFHASLGWDWIQTIRGRETGIWNDVWLERCGPVRILDPTVRFGFKTLETLPPILDTTQVQVTLGATLVNGSDYPVETVWEGSYGDIPFSQVVSIPARESRRVSTQIELDHPKLWWPNGYGEPHLYTVTMRAGYSHARSFSSGIRRFDYDTSDGSLRIWVNGRRLVGRGGNWGFSESNLRYRAEDYERAMQLHRHENFNLVRNWVGMIGDEEFYEAADRNGILVWQDFWLANPADGPDPDNEPMFMANAENMLKRIRNHPSLLLWCGRN